MQTIDWIPTEAIARGQAPPSYAVLRDFPELSDYRSWRFLGGGAFGRVFAGMHAELGRIEAVKRMELADPRVRHLALEEVRLMAQLPPHPHLVTLYDAAEGQGAIYMTMQFIDGKPLDDTPLPLTVEKALGYTRDAAEALSLVHGYGYVHRDIKPANLFSTRTQQGVLGDFGVARALDSQERTAAIAGTPAYMAPEAFVGRATAASDLWSLGVMLYELLVGRRPFQQAEGLPLDQVYQFLTHARLELPSMLRPGIPPRVDDLVAMLLAWRPEDRMPSALAVIDHLPRYETVVSVVDADMTTLNVDALVVSGNTLLAMNLPGSAVNAVLGAGGADIQTQALRAAPVVAGQVVVTTGGGRLAARQVLHAVAVRVDPNGFLQPAAERDVRKALWTALRKAHELKLRTIALPAFGTRSGGMSPEDSARILVDVVHTYLTEFRPPFERVYFAVQDRLIGLAFREAALERGVLLM